MTSPSPLWLAIAALAATAASVRAEAQTAAARGRPVAIAPQALDRALTELALKTGVDILFAPDLTAGLRSRRAAGDADAPADIARQLLAGLGLVVERRGGALVIRLGAPPTRPKRRAAPPPPSSPARARAPHRAAVADIVVTALRQSQALSDAPLSVAVADARFLEQRRIHGLADLAAGAVPSLRLTPYVGRASTYAIAMRGVGSGEASQISRDSAVGIYQDGVYFGRVQGLGVDFLDIERIEVLRGPQGALFGRNAMGGAVNLVSRRPSGRLALTQTLGVEDLGGRSAAAHLDLPAVADVSIRLSGQRRRRGGWVKNRLPGAWDWNAYDKWGLRGAAQWTPGAAWTLFYAAEYARADMTGGYAQIVSRDADAPPLPPIIGLEPGRRRVGRLPAPLAPSVAHIASHTIIGEWRPADAITVRSITAWRRLSQSQYDQYAGGYYAFEPNGAAGRVSLAHVYQHQFSEELQITGALGGVDFVAGAYGFDERARDVSRTLRTFRYNAAGTAITLLDPPLSAALPDRASSNRATSFALFGQVDAPLPAAGGRLRLVSGLRFSSDRKRGRMGIARGQLVDMRYALSLRRLDPVVSLRYAVSDAVNAYIRWGTGFRSGGAHSRSPSFRTFREEAVDNREIGLKADLPGRRGHVAISAYRARYTGMQVEFISPDNVLLGETINAAQSTTITGLELDGEVDLRPGLRAAVSYAFTAIALPPQRNPYSGRTERVNMPYSPRHAASVALDWRIGRADRRHVAWHLNAALASGSYTSLDDPSRSAAPVLVNTRVTLAELWAGASLALWSMNLFNARYDVFDYAYRQPGLTGTLQKTYNAPRSIGLEATIAW